ncbi:MAG TPA: T9SS type A sorting domain-containing protein [Bacteroidia bacterium]|nr:T9SS type A sorting domain-containing protein [Bacteroidia bacterium]HNU32536.1 T9SS type A sorting domain-containing protein [Bacteroidia bacterium]
MERITPFIAVLLLAFSLQAQNKFPQEKINAALNYNAVNKWVADGKQTQSLQTSSPFSVLNKMQNFSVPDVIALQNFTALASDTLIVGIVPNDTLIISGNWNHDGPIWVFNNGVLIFDSANVTNTNGDLIVWQSGKVIADSSSFFFPQQYFYERSFIAVQNAQLSFTNCNFNFSGMSHNLVLADSAMATFNNIHHNDWTTCGMFGAPTLNINGCNLTGEYILAGTSQSAFKNADTLLLWHYLPDSAIVNYSFPAGDTVYNYTFNNSVAGVDGVGYSVIADSCHTVWWALMPVNGSDVTISNSTLRAIGNWFERGDTANVIGIFNNSNYTNYNVPLMDRNQQLINSYVQTWSMYVFDSSQIFIDSCQLGEVGTQQQASVLSQDFILDGSGGYFWATDSSGIIASNVAVYTTVRSEKKGIFLLAYSLHPFTAPSAIGESVVVCAQNILGGDPVAFSKSTAWLQNISAPDTVAVNTTTAINGSVWIDQGPLGSWMDFGSYSLSYASIANGVWYPLVVDSVTEIRNSVLALINTQGLAVGDYLFRLTIKNNLGDSVESYKPFYITQQVSIEEAQTRTDYFFIHPNPVRNVSEINFKTIYSDNIIEVKNMAGQVLFNDEMPSCINVCKYVVDFSFLAPGIYVVSLHNQFVPMHKKIIKQ